MCLSSIGRFHFFALAVELARIGVLQRIYTGYPASIARKAGIPADRVASFPWLVAPGIAAGGLLPSQKLREAYNNAAHELHDRWVASRLDECEIFHGLSRYNLRAGMQAKRQGASYLCEVGSSHILEQIDIFEKGYGISRFSQRFPMHRLELERELAEYEQADRIIVLSTFAWRSFIKHGISESKLICLPPGVNVERFKPADHHRDGRGKDPFTVLFVGSVSLHKGTHVLVEAFKKARLAHSQLLLVGAVSPSMKAYLESLGAQNVRFLGVIPNAKLASYYRDASVFVLPSFEDGFGMVALEAMACGCPVIISTNAGAADAVEEGKSGFVVPAGDADALAERLTELHRNPSSAYEMGRRAAWSVRKSGTWKEYGDKMAGIYRQLIRMHHK